MLAKNLVANCKTTHFLALVLMCACCVFTAASKASLPDIGNPADRVLSAAKERAMGARFYRKLQQKNLIENDPIISSYIQSVGNRITAGIGEQEFKFFVVKDNRVNAFAVPGGYIGINQGLIMATRNEGELASVIAHETAHVTQRHIARFWANSDSALWMQLGAFLAGIALASQGQAQAGTATIFAGSALSQQKLITNTRIHELEADRIGIQYLAQAGYDPMQMANFMALLLQLSQGASQDFEILRTHPLTGNRVAEAKSLAGKIKASDNATVNTKRFEIIKRLLISKTGDKNAMLRHFKQQQKRSELDDYSYALFKIQNAEALSAAAILKRLIATDKASIEYKLALNEALIAQKKYKQASQNIQQLLLTYPNYLPLQEQLLTLYRKTKNYRQIAAAAKSYKSNYQNLSLKMLTTIAHGYNELGNKVMAQFYGGIYLYHKGEYRAAKLQLLQAKKQLAKFSVQQRAIIEDLLQKLGDAETMATKK